MHCLGALRNAWVQDPLESAQSIPISEYGGCDRLPVPAVRDTDCLCNLCLDLWIVQQVMDDVICPKNRGPEPFEQGKHGALPHPDATGHVQDHGMNLAKNDRTPVPVGEPAFEVVN